MDSLVSTIPVRKGEQIMETLELPTLLRPLRRWWWLVVAATLLAAFSSLIYSLRQPAVYTSRTTLIVGSTISNPNPTGTDILFSTTTSLGLFRYSQARAHPSVNARRFGYRMAAQLLGASTAQFAND